MDHFELIELLKKDAVSFQTIDKVLEIIKQENKKLSFGSPLHISISISPIKVCDHLFTKHLSINWINSVNNNGESLLHLGMFCY